MIGFSVCVSFLSTLPPRLVPPYQSRSLLHPFVNSSQMLAEIMAELKDRNGGSLDFSAAGIAANGGGHHD